MNEEYKKILHLLSAASVDLEENRKKAKDGNSYNKFKYVNEISLETANDIIAFFNVSSEFIIPPEEYYDD